METASIEDGDVRTSLLVNNDDCSPRSHGTTFPVVFSTLVAVCGSFVFGCAVGYSSPTESGIMADLGLTSAEFSVFASILSIGAMFGAVFSGKVADLIGRRGAMLVSEIFCIVGWLAIVFTESAWWLDLGRLLLGCGIGLLSYLVPVYVAEITTKDVRGVFTSFNQLMIGFGKAFMFLVGTFVNWRTLALIGAIPCLLQLVGLFFIPESPRWLVKMGRVNEFESTLQKLRGQEADISQEASDIKHYTDKLQHLSEDGILNLFQWRYAKSIIVGVGLMVFQECGGINGFAFYASSIFSSAGFSSNAGTISAAVIQIIGIIMGVILIEKCGRRPLLLVFSQGNS